MKKIYIYIIVLMVIIGILSGIFINKLTKTRNKQFAEANFSVVTDDCIDEKEKYEFAMLNLEAANANIIKISPNANITFKICYKECGHTIVEKEKVEENLVNLTKEEIQAQYNDWSIEEFKGNNIILYKEEDGICNEHYFLKEENGYIVIYELKQNLNKQLLKVTDISTKYLPESDLIEIGKGMTIYTKQELNKFLEDYE